MKLFRIKRKSDGLFFLQPKKEGVMPDHDELGTFFTKQPQAVATLLSTTAYAKDYVLEMYSLHRQGVIQLNSSWGEQH